MERWSFGWLYSTFICLFSIGVTQRKLLYFTLFVSLAFSPNLLNAGNHPVDRSITQHTAFGCNGVLVEIRGKVNAQSSQRSSNSALLLSNGNCNVMDNAFVGGDVFAGPGKTVTVDPNAVVTGEIGTKEEECSCVPVNLSTVIGELIEENNNALVPLTEKGRDPLDEDGNLVVRGSDTLILPAGEYLFSSVKINGGSTLSVDGRVFLTVDGPIEIDGTSSLNPEGNPYYLIIYTTTDEVVMGGDTDASATFYIPNGIFKLFGGAELDTGGIFAKEVIITGNSIINDLTDTQAPTVTFLSPTEETRISGDDTPTIQIQLIDDDELDMDTFQVTLNGSDVTANFTTCSTPAQTCVAEWTDISPLGNDGNYIFEATISDLAENVTTSTLIYELDTTAPLITVINFPEVEPQGTPPMVPNIVVEDIHEWSMTATLNGEPFLNRTPLVRAGTYILDVSVTDQAGNNAVLHKEGLITYNLEFSILQPQKGDEVYETNPLISGTFQTYIQNDARSALVSAKINGEPALLEWIDDTSGKWYVKNLYLAPGENELCFDFHDFWGNHLDYFVEPCFTVQFQPKIPSEYWPSILSIIPVATIMPNNWAGTASFRIISTDPNMKLVCLDYTALLFGLGTVTCQEEVSLRNGETIVNHDYLVPSGLMKPTAFGISKGERVSGDTVIQVPDYEDYKNDMCGNLVNPFIEALDNGNLELALLYMMPEIRDKYRVLFQAIMDTGYSIPQSWPECEEGIFYIDVRYPILWWPGTGWQITFTRDQYGFLRISGL